MKYLLALMLVLFTACTYEDSRCPNYPMESFLQLEQDVRENWPGPGQFTGDELIAQVTCVDEKPVSPRTGTVYKWGFVDFEEDGYYITIRNLPTLRMTAYIHELVHIGLWEEAGDPDPDHLEGDGPWEQKHEDMIFSLWGI